MKYALGTAQLGMKYGIANSTGQPSEQQAIEMLQLSKELGISLIDTARSYGSSEEVIGKYQIQGGDIPVCTKLNPLDLNSASLISDIKDSLATSFKYLKTPVNYFLFHRWSTRKNPQVFEALLSEKSNYGELGASALNYNEAIEILKDPSMTMLQIPCNLLDHRAQNGEFLQALKSRPDCKIVVRSALLQGLLTESPVRHPKNEGFDSNLLSECMNTMMHKLGRKNYADLCYAYLRGLDWIHYLLIGADNIDQLKSNFQLLKNPSLNPDEMNYVNSQVSKLEVTEDLLSPFSWKLN